MSQHVTNSQAFIAEAPKRANRIFFSASQLVLCAIVVTSEVAAQANERLRWQHLSSATGDFLAPAVGDQSASLVLDIDRDGKDDLLVCGWGDTSIVWYTWKGNRIARYLVDNSNSPSIGGAFHDLDGDGDQDVVFGGAWQSNHIWWWENPYPVYKPERPWKKHVIRDSGTNGYHDQIFGDFDRDGKTELVSWNKSSGNLLIADVPENAADKNAWKFQVIWHWETGLNYEGLSAFDLDGDGDTDIAGGGYWFEHRHEKEFEAHRIDDYAQSRTQVGDLIKGGRPEVVLSSGDGVGPLNLYEWRDGRWRKTALLGQVVHGHTLQIADIDGDGNLDIFTAEMAQWAGGENPASRSWILCGDGTGGFTTEELGALSDIGNHESRIGDLNGDGRLDIFQKPFQKDVPRLDFWIQKN